MRFIEMTGSTLADIVKDEELHVDDLQAAGIRHDSIVRINEHGDIEVRRADHWDVIGGLLGSFADRIQSRTGLDWA